MRLFGLIGYPLTHSFSKGYFSKKFEREGFQDCRFENFPLSSLDQLRDQVLNRHPHLEGFAVTIPYKQAVRQYLHSENIPPGLNACNCIKTRDGKLVGYNTDYIGFERSFMPLAKSHHTKALILGNGGSAAAVAFVLKKNGIPFNIVSRQLHEGSTLTYDDINEEIINENPIIINTTPLGMYPNVEACPPIPYSALSPDHYLYDLIYNPEKTLFLERGESKGAVVKNGADMLVYQAEENWRIWNEL